MRLWLAAFALLGFGCAPDSPAAPTPRRSAFDPVEIPADNPMNPAKIELGRLLFHDPILSSDRTVACATCHGQIWGLSDGLQYSVGIGGIGPAGTGRRGPTRTRRNSSTLWNVALRTAFFWDGRVRTLEAQALGPMNDPLELGRPPADVARDLSSIAEYVRLFGEAFPGERAPVTADNLAKAIAAFERTLLSTYAPYDRFVDGDTGALDARATRGWALFQSLQCSACHTAPRFERERYEPSFAPATPEVPDEGRFEVTRVEADRGRYLVPTLRNVGETPPYFHNGSVSQLAEAVRLEARGRPGGRELASAEADDLVTFLRAGLTDMHANPQRPDTVPSGLMVPADGYRIPR